MKRLDHYWYSNNPVSVLLLPLSWLFRLVATLRRAAYRAGLLKVTRLPVPVIVVGNISVGGAGKTPLVIWLAEFLKQRGYRPAIVSRGYGGQARAYPLLVTPDSDPLLAGDEAVLLARRCSCPMAVAPDRVAAARKVLEAGCDIIISDDGLQHYRLGRDIEIAVIDGARRFGNGRCLPAGPLREPPGRLKRVDLVVVNGGPAETGRFEMRLRSGMVRNLVDEGIARDPAGFQGETVHAVAGIGHPARFFGHLKKLGLNVTGHPFPDHHPYTAQDLQFGDDAPIIMTEKDAVKCRKFADAQHWYLPVAAELSGGFGERLVQLLGRRIDFRSL
ncbi:MAG: tetraacyldisaccharide 4'-kinase [Pseudomonadota bacterium]